MVDLLAFSFDTSHISKCIVVSSIFRWFVFVNAYYDQQRSLIKSKPARHWGGNQTNCISKTGFRSLVGEYESDIVMFNIIPLLKM